MTAATAGGRYLVLEGGEGVGKTTQAARLARRLQGIGLDAVVVREPGGEPFAEAGRALLLGDLPRAPEAEVLMFNALRAQVLVSRVVPGLAAGQWIISDRSRLSTIAYQGYGHGLDLVWTRSVCATCTALRAPDLEVILHVDEQTSLGRRAARGTTDRFEQQDASFHRRVTEGYLAEAERDGIAVIDASGSEEEVERALWQLIEPLLSGSS